MSTTEKVATASDRELVLTRIINAPREKVFRAWTDPELLKAVVRASALHDTRRGN